MHGPKYIHRFKQKYTQAVIINIDIKVCSKTHFILNTGTTMLDPFCNKTKTILNKKIGQT